MNAQELLDAMATHGVRAWVQDGKLKLSAPQQPPERLLNAIQESKAALFSLLNPQRTPSEDGCPSHWLHIPLLPAKGETVTPTEAGRYRVCLFGTWYVIRFYPNVSEAQVRATSDEGRYYELPSLDSLYRALWAERQYAELTTRIVN